MACFSLARSGRAGWAWVLLALTAGCGDSGPPASAPAVPEPSAATQDTCGDDTSYIAGSTALCAGKLVYRDDVYDDYGAGNGLTNMPYSAATL